MLKCPDCGRKFPDPGPDVSFEVGEHLNYMKTARCPGSGRRFVNASGPHLDMDPGVSMYGFGSLGFALPTIALWAASSRTRPRRRYR